ncbi:chromosome partitioning ATPase [Shewanella hanedai]|uniref:Chromosome partitioning protein ParA n=1 Tax=Shewanella hanedai TaxID=25 RepID=A0A553JUL9_SHEHA|nr:chromosome partitioning protein ParA [Shewanella hanedai]TRY16146.1 chromosome partitioning protein ParA [Shewanella hanedai]GGI66950.1 chromosome partitioning ATPase [Shewanella hanedai]
MFDLAKAITKNSEQTREQAGPASCSFYYQTSVCLELIEQVFRFEGWNIPDCVKNTNPGELQLNALRDIVILELNESKNVVKDAREFAAKLPNQKGVIVIGKEDTITTLRELKDMGIYYLFWPLNQEELSEFLRHVHNNLQQLSGVNKNRKAKRVAVVGTKGGIGNTMITCELAATLAYQGVETIQVDHQYFNSNTDILLGLKKFERQDTDNLSLQLRDMDEVSASNYLSKVDEHWRLLAFGGSQSADALYNDSQNIADLLSRQANFIIEDFSSSNDFVMDPALLSDRVDLFVVVLDATVSSVRNASQIIEKIELHNLSGTADIRILTFLNIHRPEGGFPLKKDEVERYLARPIDVHLGYAVNFSALMLSGKRLHRLEKQNGAFNKLAQLIQGKQPDAIHSPLNRIMALVKR